MRTVFTNGCFDILHAGHARLLRDARALGDRLIVGLNSNASVTRIKGAPRPFVDEEDRRTLLLELRAVDEVIIFEEDTPERLIRELRPDILAKGGDYTVDTIVGSGFVRSYGGRVVVLPFFAGRSTSDLVERIMAAAERTRASPS